MFNTLLKYWRQAKAQVHAKIPVVYSSGYNFGLAGLEKLHPFDTHKYEKVALQLRRQFGLKANQFHCPALASDEALRCVHPPSYLSRVKDPRLIAQILEVPLLARLPHHFIQNNLLRPMQLATGGTVLAVQLALQFGWAINLSGGYHHAKADQGGGFCIYADIPVAVFQAWKRRPELRVLVVDLDAHQGNGIEAIFADDGRIRIFDMYNADIYPQDFHAARHIDYNLPLPAGTTDDDYLRLLQAQLPEAIEVSEPDLLIYNAGSDVYHDDLLGGLQLSADAIAQRDAFVFSQASLFNLPIAMTLSGGYSPQSATLVFDSIAPIVDARLQTLEYFRGDGA